MSEETTNEQRAERAYRTLLQGQYMAGSSEEVEEAITDLMTDLLHLGDQHDVDQLTLLERITATSFPIALVMGFDEDCERDPQNPCKNCNAMADKEGK